MRRKKTIITEAIFCDHCGKEIDETKGVVVAFDNKGLQYDFCSVEHHKEWEKNKRETNK